MFDYVRVFLNEIEPRLVFGLARSDRYDYDLGIAGYAKVWKDFLLIRTGKSATDKPNPRHFFIKPTRVVFNLGVVQELHGVTEVDAFALKFFRKNVQDRNVIAYSLFRELFSISSALTVSGGFENELPGRGERWQRQLLPCQLPLQSLFRARRPPGPPRCRATLPEDKAVVCWLFKFKFRNNTIIYEIKK